MIKNQRISLYMRYSLPQDRSTRFTNQKIACPFLAHFPFYPLAYNMNIYVFIYYIYIYIICIYIYTHILKVKLSIYAYASIYILYAIWWILFFLYLVKALLYHFLSENLCDPHSEQVTLSPLQIDLQIANFQNCEYALKLPMKMEAQRKDKERQEEEEATEDLKRFTARKMARGLSLSDEAPVIFEAQEPNT